MASRWALQRGQDGRPVGSLTTTPDITDQKLAQERETYQALLLENVNDAIIGTDASLHITAWNCTAEEMYGQKAEEVMGANVLEVVRSGLTAAERAAAPATFIEDERWRGEIMHVRRDGTPFWVEARAVACVLPAGSSATPLPIATSPSAGRRKKRSTRRKSASRSCTRSIS